MDKFILNCTNCGQMFKCDKTNDHTYTTDYGDILTPDKYGNITCPCCKKEMNPLVIRTSDWIADMVFTIKGK